MLTVRSIRETLPQKAPEIRHKLKEFENIIKNASEEVIFEELVFCIFTAGTSARMGLSALSTVRSILRSASEDELRAKLRGVYRFPNVRSKHVIHTRNYLAREYGLKLRPLLLSFKDPVERRDFFALNKDIKGLGFKEASHFLRNIGFRGYAILDKHILQCLFELGITESSRAPHSRSRYIEIENKFKKFSERNGFDFDEMDLFLWSEKTGEILK
ncbi:MAG: N-glycosylase/DNA lyase [Candidatus Dadabacteria bacterium]|nr:N-glycosylase/DNA lyase [Candidatus Dadabacteria bacterium]MXZ13709.1 N-glycosylase/DNA lyase [Candidatus Dadabacteria bacterium]MYA48177.1 N-glycosylase/DNA lyase [Candidatus Dadabacteria bacterium]MYC40390.1 N-glycosylase/DNA lyase [Candidatus Dadabacteria bacterium]MYG83647.1 N-glycosylase/DNA lyase [Candidatus Dadabacteria bacterium]